MKVLNIAVMGLFLCSDSYAQPPDRWVEADTQTVRIAPRKFSALPLEISDDLERRGCTIPQAYGVRGDHNVVQGEFRKNGQKDWAILCSVKRSSAILIYWNASPKDISRLADGKDADFLQEVEPGRIGFSRLIDIVDANYILGRYRAYGGPQPPHIKHQGINDIWVEKASAVNYLHRGKWLKLQGAD